MYRMFIDECGNHDLKSASNPNERYLGLTGIITDLDFHTRRIFPEMEELKAEFWPDHSPAAPVILHRMEILHRRNSFGVLDDPEISAAFDRRLLGALRDWDYTVVTVVIDKAAHLAKYGVWAEHPYHYCMEVLLERYVFFLYQMGARGDVMAEARGRKPDRELEDVYSRLYDRGSRFVGSARTRTYLTSRQLKISAKTANVAGLQLADLLAYPSRLDVLYNNRLEAINSHPFQDQVLDILQPKYYTHRHTGAIDGCGRKLLP